MSFVSRLPSSHSPLRINRLLRQTNAYSSHVITKIIDDISQVSVRYPSLQPILDDFETKTEAPESRLALRGTLPVKYKGITYRIPVHIWIMPYHPEGPPVAFVTPTRNMALRRQHPHVHYGNGMVYLPYFSDWGQHSTLVDAVCAMIEAFETKPPVYTRAEEGEHVKRDLVEDLTQRIRERLLEEVAKGKDLIFARDTSKRLLQKRREELETIARKRQPLENKAAFLRWKVRVLKWWLQLHPASTGNIDMDTRPRALVREQAVTFMAGDIAYADAMDVMNECLVRGVLKGASFVERIRSLARLQFEERFMTKKAKHKIAELKEARRQETMRRAIQQRKEEAEMGRRVSIA